MKLPVLFLLLPAAVGAQTITTFTNRAAFEAAMGNFKVVDDFSLVRTFFDVTTNNGGIDAHEEEWADIARDPEPSTIWATPFGSTAFGGKWDNSIGGVGGGLAFDLDFGGGNIVTVPGIVPGNAPFDAFFGFTASQPFFNVRERQFNSAGNTLQETHALDDLTVQVPADWQDVRFVQGGAGAWDTAGHWDLTAVPGPNQRVFILPAGGAVVSGPVAAANVRQLVIGNGTVASRLNLDAAGPLTINRGSIVRANSTLGGAGRFEGTLTMATGSTLTVADGQTLQVGTAAANGTGIAGRITVGTGTLILEDTGDTQIGTLTTISGGTLTALGGTVHIGSGDTLRGNGALTGAFELLPGGTLRAESGTLQVAQLTAADGTVTVDATRTLSIGGTNTMGFSTTTVGAGGTLSVGGRVQLVVTSTLGAGATVSGATGLDLAGSVSHAGAQVFNAGTGDLTIFNTSFTPDAADSLLGARLVMDGTLAMVRFSNEATLGAAGNQLVLKGGRLFPLSSVTLPPARSIEVTAQNGSVIALAGTNFTIEGNISGAGRIALTGSSGGALGGTVRLAGNNTHAGGMDIAGVTLEIASDANLGGPNGVLLIGRENGFTPIPGRLRALGNLNITATRSTTFRHATVDTNGFDVTFNQPVSGQDLTKQGAGVLRFNTANTFNTGVNNVVIEGGTVRCGVNEALGQPRVFLFDTTFDLNGFAQTVSILHGTGEVRLGNGGALTLIGGSTIDAIITGAGSLSFGHAPFSAESYRLLGQNTFTGPVSITRGNRVSVKTTTAFGAAGNPVLLDNGGIESDSEAPGPVVISAGAPFTIGAGGAFFGANGQSLVIDAQLTGNVPIGVRGGGAGYEVRFANPSNTFTSAIKLGERFDDEVLGIVADGSLGNAANIVTLGDRFFDGETTSVSQGTLRAFASLTLPASRVVRLNGDANSFNDSGGAFDTNGFNMTVEGAISQMIPNMPLLKTGTGILTLNGANTYTGETEVAEGTLSGTGTIGAVRIHSGGTLAPGSSPGTLHTGNVTFDSGSTFAIEFASPTLGDQLAVTGSVTLNGDVELSLAPGFTPAVASTFVVIANDGTDPTETSGDTALFTIGGNQLPEGETFSAAGASWKISYTGGTGNDVTLTSQAAPAAGPDFTAFTFGPPSGGGPGVQITASISGPASTLVNFEASDNLVAWTIIGSDTTTGAGVASFNITDTAATGSRRYYRAVIP